MALIRRIISCILSCSRGPSALFRTGLLSKSLWTGSDDAKCDQMRHATHVPAWIRERQSCSIVRVRRPGTVYRMAVLDESWERGQSSNWFHLFVCPLMFKLKLSRSSPQNFTLLTLVFTVLLHVRRDGYSTSYN